MSENKPLQPVKPAGMEIVFYYHCPFCKRKVPLVAPTGPSMGQCDMCHKQFPVVPADEKTLRFLKTVLDNGKAGIDADFI